MVFKVFKKQNILSSIVEDEEPLARYIFSKSHFRRANGSIKFQAFMPNLNLVKKTVSVIRHKDCSETCLLKIGKNMATKRGHSLKAVCSLSAKNVRSIDGLDVESDTSRGQHRRHANIMGFNNWIDAKIRQIAKELAEKADLLNLSDEQ